MTRCSVRGLLPEQRFEGRQLRRHHVALGLGALSLLLVLRRSRLSGLSVFTLGLRASLRRVSALAFGLSDRSLRLDG